MYIIRNFIADNDCGQRLCNITVEKIISYAGFDTFIYKIRSMLLKMRNLVDKFIRIRDKLCKACEDQGRKKVVIIGGGPAGLEAARTASIRGNKVVLYEKSNKLGGSLNIASAAVFKEDMRNYLEWSIRSVENDKNIEIKINTEADENMIKNENADAVFIAIGSKPVMPEFKMSKTEKVDYSGSAELKKVNAINKIIIVGSGFRGLETALSLALEGKDITVIDKVSEEKIDVEMYKSIAELKQMLYKYNVKFRYRVNLIDVIEEGALIEDENQNKELLECDKVILSYGVKTDRDEVEKFKDLAEDTYIIGDCNSDNGGNLYNAIKTAFDCAMEL